MSSPLSGFRKWLLGAPGVWSTMRVAGVAVRTGQGWVARRLVVSLESPLQCERVVQTPHVLVFEKHMPAGCLPRLLWTLAHGKVPAVVVHGAAPVEFFRGHLSAFSGDQR